MARDKPPTITGEKNFKSKEGVSKVIQKRRHQRAPSVQIVRRRVAPDEPTLRFEQALDRLLIECIGQVRARWRSKDDQSKQR